MNLALVWAAVGSSVRHFAIELPCPRCKAAPNQPCPVKSGAHSAREDAALSLSIEASREADRVVAIKLEKEATEELAQLVSNIGRLIAGPVGFITLESVEQMIREEAFAVRPHGRFANYQRAKATIGPALRTRVYERNLYRCVTCNTHRDLTCDHIKPESKGGSTTLENLQTMCRPCNSRKGAR